MRIVCLLVIVVTGCGPVKRPFDDAAAPDAAVPATTPTPAWALVNAAGRLTGTTFTFEVEIGHPIGQQSVKSATYTLQGNVAVKP